MSNVCVWENQIIKDTLDSDMIERDVEWGVNYE